MHQLFLYAVVYFNLYRITTINISTNKTRFVYLFTKLDSRPPSWNDQEGCSPPCCTVHILTHGWVLFAYPLGDNVGYLSLGKRVLLQYLEL